MSDEENVAEDSGETQMLHAQYKDGQLQIVEVTPFPREKHDSILPDVITTDGDQQKYMQVLDIGSGSSKGLMQLDLLNLTLVRCEDGEESYRLVTNSEHGSELPADATVALLQSSDDDPDNNDYVMVDGSQGLVFLQADDSLQEMQEEEEEEEEPEVELCEEVAPPPPTPPPAPAPAPPEKKRKLAPHEIIERARALQRAKAILSSQIVRPGKRGRRRAGDIPSPHELLASPNFKLYLYSCKMCAFKCNAVKELQAHRKKEHAPPPKPRGSAAGPIAMQCARCPYKGATQNQLVKHVQDVHLAPQTTISESIVFTNKVSLDSKEVEEADVLVCGACGYESSDREAFRTHIEREHGACTT